MDEGSKRRTDFLTEGLQALQLQVFSVLSQQSSSNGQHRCVTHLCHIPMGNFNYVL